MLNKVDELIYCFKMIITNINVLIQRYEFIAELAVIKIAINIGYKTCIWIKQRLISSKDMFWLVSCATPEQTGLNVIKQKLF